MTRFNRPFVGSKLSAEYMYFGLSEFHVLQATINVGGFLPTSPFLGLLIRQMRWILFAGVDWGAKQSVGRAQTLEQGPQKSGLYIS